MLVRLFSDIHAEFWQPNKIPRILEMVVPPLPTDKETVALVAGDIGLAHRQETWLKVVSLLAKRFRVVIYVEGNHFFYHNEIIDHGPDLWVHGHTHNSFDYSLGKTRVVVNPYGYKDVEVNPQYDRQLVIEL
jgi:predicted phosphodiesterase